MIITQPLEITTPDGRGTGRWRLVEMSDEHDVAERTPHVARAWEAAAVAILKARGVTA